MPFFFTTLLGDCTMQLIGLGWSLGDMKVVGIDADGIFLSKEKDEATRMWLAEAEKRAENGEFHAA
jgi:hypothetical protein